MKDSEYERVVIIGASIAGSTLALLLAKAGFDVSVYEQKSLEDVGKKICANIVTSDILEILEKLGISAEKIIDYSFKKAVFISKNNRVEFKIEDYHINRIKLIKELVKNARKNGAKFFFKRHFNRFSINNKRYFIGINNDIVKADYLIGADGALSEVAKQSGLSSKRKLFLCIQTKIELKKLKMNINRENYYIFLNKDFGYYSYIFPSEKYATIGSASYLDDNPEQHFNNFLNFLKISKNIEKEAALIPAPAFFPRIKKENLFLIGDAGLQAKFSGGGIIPAMKFAFAVRDVLLNKDYGYYKLLLKNIRINAVATKILSKMSDDDFKRFIEIIKDKKFEELVGKRDGLNKSAWNILRERRLYKFLKYLF